MTAKPSKKTIDMQIASEGAGMVGKYKLEVFTVKSGMNIEQTFIFDREHADEAADIIDSNEAVTSWTSHYIIRTNKDDCNTLDDLNF
ncbi:MAG TPA: hypothetical protein VFZ66_29800 [Herpetosiphonaceae bacterium]